ncbi:MAG: TonB-dependent receptor [Rhodospirillaceae bacterium]|nr:TonB-dependent receptor [Rhodospirillaceae bacterium]MBT6088559.1 TonB-dependent receptor [Rhodospirillaceae bacterium]
MPRFLPLALRAALTFFVFGFALDLQAQTSPEPTDMGGRTVSADGTKTTYEASFFTRFNPLSLQDMLQRIPGASISNSVATSERRGLRGNEDAILINGQQITGKDSGGASALQRITANQVLRIEILRGSSSEVQSTTQRIINVILRQDGGDTLTLTAALPNYTNDGSARPIAGVTYAVNEPNRNYSIGIASNPIYRPWQRTKITSDLSGQDILSSVESEQHDRYTIQTTGRYEQTFESGSRLQLNGLGSWLINNRERREVLRDPQQPIAINQLSDSLEIDKRDEFTVEISADYSFPLGEADTVTFLALVNWEKENRDRDVFDLEPLDEPVIVRQLRQDIRTEAIARGTYDRTFSPTLGGQIGLEGTLNTQKTDFDLSTLVDGALVPLAIFNSDGKVTEYRGEAFSTLRWKPWGTVEAEFGLAVEASRIRQTSVDVNSARSLFFVKPTLNVYWDVTPQNKLFFSVVRDVGQLNFANFVASITSTDQELEAGNPDIKPTKSWDYEVGLEHRLADGVGVITGRAFYRYLQDPRGRLSFNGLVSQIGNIGDGEEYGAEGEISIDFTRLGWWDGVLTADYLRRKTSVVDPFDNVSRRFGFTPNWETSFEYRHEIKTIIDGHVSVNYSQFGARFINDIDKQDRLKEGGSMTISLEHRLTDNIRINFSSNNFLNRTTIREREILAFAPEGGRVLTGTRRDRSQWGRIYNVFIRGTF